VADPKAPPGNSTLARPDRADWRGHFQGTGGKAFVRFCARSTQEFLANNTMQMAAAIAFYAFFSLFPLSFLMLLAFHAFAPSSVVEEEQLTRIISTFIPVSQDIVARSIRTAVDARETIGPLALIGVIWASTAAFATIRKGINTAWNIWTPRPFLKERIIDLALTAGAGLLFILLLVIMSILRSYALDEDLDTAGGVFGGPAWLSVSSGLLSFAAFTVLYRFLPNRRVHLRNVLFGALAAALAFEIAKGAFFAYNQGREDINQLYGSLTSAAVLLGWLYISAVIVLIGALVGSIYTSLVERRIVTHADIWSLGIYPGVQSLRRWRRTRARPSLGASPADAPHGPPPASSR
jgi:membrane protein